MQIAVTEILTCFNLKQNKRKSLRIHKKRFVLKIGNFFKIIAQRGVCRIHNGRSKYTNKNISVLLCISKDMKEY